MTIKRLVLAAVAMSGVIVTVAISPTSAETTWKQGIHHRTRIVIHPRPLEGPYPGWQVGSNAYPAHSVPLAAYPAAGGIGITLVPFGWTGWRR